MNKKKISINGQFFCAPYSGTRKVAEELILEIDRVISQNPEAFSKLEVNLIVPKNIELSLKLNAIQVVRAGFLSGLLGNVLWEQINLPFLSNGSTLLSLCNMSPVFVKNAIVMIHDAQVFMSPKSYSYGLKTWYKFAMSKLGKNSKKIITVSEFSKSQLASFGVANNEKITVIHNGVDHILKAQADQHVLKNNNLAELQYCIAHANTQAHKNIEVLIKAFALPALKSTRLVLYGAKKKEDFEALGLFVPENIIFIGRVSDEELKVLIENALATLTPSLTEGFGLQPLEGMILGCPAIVSPKGALAEVCGDVGLYANPYQPEAWVKAINYLIENDDFRLVMKNKVQIHAQKFTWKNAAQKVLALLET